MSNANELHGKRSTKKHQRQLNTLQTVRATIKRTYKNNKKKTSNISAKSFVSSLFDVHLCSSTFLEMICGIALTEFLFNFFITFFILVRIYVFYTYASKMSAFISKSNSIVCYLQLVAITLNIRSRYMFGIKSFKNARICNR